MARINLSEINLYIKNFFERIGLRDLEKVHADRIKQWLIENLSNIGRYSVRDFERTGNLNSFGKHPIMICDQLIMTEQMVGFR